MDLGLRDKTVLVTGGGQGIGRAICRLFAAEGAKVAVNDLFPERADAVADEIRRDGGTAIPAAADIIDVAAVAGMVGKIENELGSVDILVNNAGIVPERREKGGLTPLFKDMPHEDWAKVIDLNVYGTMNCCAAVLPGMLASGSGKIVSIISEAARLGETRFAVYSGAKAAILGFSRALAREHGRDRINVNIVALGAVAHEGIKSGPLRLEATPENDDVLAKMLSAYPIGRGLGRVGTTGDVASMVAFLSSPHADFVTGQSIGVSGGYAMI